MLERDITQSYVITYTIFSNVKKDNDVPPGPSAPVEDISSGNPSTNMEDCCDNILVCGTTDNHAAVTGTYSLVISFSIFNTFAKFIFFIETISLI